MAEQSLFTPEEFKKFKKSKGVKRSRSEDKIQVQVCKYLKERYPDVIFMCDLASGMNLGKFIGGMNTRLRSSRGLPDLFIAHPYRKNFDPNISPEVERIFYHGLFIELKTENQRLKNGGIKRTDHHDEQAEILARLKQMGYQAQFCCGYDEAIKLIDEYLK